MKTERVDRRVQRTRQLLKEALRALIVEQDYDSITVQNIIDRANLGRSTFYAHYQDKDDLLLSGMEEVVHGLIQGVESSPLEGQGHEKQRPILFTQPIFAHAQEPYQLHKAIVGGRGMEAVIQTIQTHLTAHVQERIDLGSAAGASELSDGHLTEPADLVAG